MVRKVVRKVTRKVIRKVIRKVVQKNEKTIISAIRSNPTLSITDMCPITGLSRSGVQKIIIRLRQQGVLRRVGPAKGGYWEIIE